MTDARVRIVNLSQSFSNSLESLSEEFGIYLNYVRKLGFEETPDYDFLKELFVKVLRAAGETDDTMFDWKLLNNGKGWEANSVNRSALRTP